MNMQLFPIVAALVGIIFVIYTVRMYLKIRRLAKSVYRAEAEIEKVRWQRSNGGKDKGDADDDDSMEIMKSMIKKQNDLQAASLIYNRAVVLYNQKLGTWPSAFFAYMFGFDKASLHNADTGSDSQNNDK